MPSNILTIKVWGRYGYFPKAKGISYPRLTPAAAMGILESIYFVNGQGPYYKILSIMDEKKFPEWIMFQNVEEDRPVNVKKLLKHVANGTVDQNEKRPPKTPFIHAIVSPIYYITFTADQDLEKVKRRLKNGYFNRPLSLGDSRFPADVILVSESNHKMSCAPPLLSYESKAKKAATYGLFKKAARSVKP